MNQVSVRDRFADAAAPRSRTGTRVLWVVWRQQRFQVLISLAVVGAMALGLVFLRLNAIGAIQSAGDEVCYGLVTSAACLNPAPGDIADRYGRIAAAISLIMLTLPPLLGVLAGGPLFAREYEQGTQVLAMTQSVRPVTWWAVKTAVAGLPVALAVLALGFVNRWALLPMTAYVSPPLSTPGFETRGIVPAAYFVLAFSVAVTLGILLRNTAAAIGATIAVYIALLLSLGFFRPTYMDPVQVVLSVTAAADQPPPIADLAYSWQVDSYDIDADGRKTTVLYSECPAPVDYQQCIIDQGVRGEVIRYQPLSRYWSIQGIEAGIALATGALVLGLGVIRLRRRVR